MLFKTVNQIRAVLNTINIHVLFFDSWQIHNNVIWIMGILMEISYRFRRNSLLEQLEY